VLQLIGFSARKTRGTQLRGVCPFHEVKSERDVTFSVNLDRHRFLCFKYGVFGNQLELWAQIQGLSLHAAAVELCQRLGIEVPWVPWIHRW
jgi:DNA primase